MAEKIKVLIVDDTRLMRRALTDLFESDSQIEVVGTAKDGKEVLTKIPELNPDVITMDIDMPIMDGLTSLKHIMMKYPIPIVVISSLAENSDINFESWRLGCIEIVQKPSGSVSEDIDRQKNEIIKKIKAAVKSNSKNIRRVRLQERITLKEGLNPQSAEFVDIVVGGAGSLTAFIRILLDYNPESNRSLIALLDFHRSILSTFHTRLNEISKIEVILAAQTMNVPGQSCILIPANDPVSITKFGKQFKLEYSQSDLIGLDNMMGNLTPEICEQSRLILLDNESESNVSNIEKWYQAGGKILYQDPYTCLFPQLVNAVIKKKIKGNSISISKMGKALSKV